MMRALALLVVGVAACRPAPVTTPTKPTEAPQTTTPVAPIAPVFDDLTATRNAACARHDGTYLCWGVHAAFPALLGVAEGAGAAIEKAVAIDRFGPLRRLVLTGEEVWAVTEAGELLAFTSAWNGRAWKGFERWTAVAGDVRDVAAIDDRICVRRRADVACWSWSLSQRPDAKTFERAPQIARTRGGTSVPEGPLTSTERRIAVDSADGCRVLDGDDEAPDSPAPCGALTTRQLEERGLPSGVDARTRGACVLVEGVRVFCSENVRAREGAAWTRTPRLVAASGGALPRDREDDEDASPKPSFVGRWSCSVDGGAVKCQRGDEPLAPVGGIRRARSIVAIDDGWVVRDASGALWRIDARGNDVPTPQKLGTGELVVGIRGRVIVRDPSGALVQVDQKGRPTPLGTDDPIGRFLAEDTWVQLVSDRAVLCGRNAAGVVGCTLVGDASLWTPLGLGKEPTFSRPPLPFAATDLFVAKQMCARSSKGEIACWGERATGDEESWVDVTDHVLAQ